MTQFAEFTEPVPGDRFIPKDNVDHVIVVRALEHKTGISTANSGPNGTDAISADVLDLDAPGGPAVYRDTLLFGGAYVDALKSYIGQLVVVKIENRKSNSGRFYTCPVAADDAAKGRAQAEFAKGDPFAAELTTVGTEDAVAPF